MKRIDSITKGWEDYELLDSGDNRKLERFGSLIIDRPDPQALWQKSQPGLWTSAQAQFTWNEKQEKWAIGKEVPHEWVISYGSTKLSLGFGKFKHIGIFPEHAKEWEALATVCKKNKGIKILNLFGYTGAASLVAASLGAFVTHVDASKQTVATVKENILLSKLPKDSVRVIVEDALKYAKRLIARGEQFDAILLDPPAFGRGPKGEIWKIEEKLPELLALIPELLTPYAELVILNGYAAGYSARSFGELLRGTLKKEAIIYGDVGIQESGSDRIVSTGIYACWQK